MWISKKKLDEKIDILVGNAILDEVHEIRKCYRADISKVENKYDKLAHLSQRSTKLLEKWKETFEEDWHKEMLEKHNTLARLEIRYEEIIKEQKRSTDVQERWLKAFCKHAGVSLEGRDDGSWDK